ncbi:hypothetical protein [Microbacterium sp.]|uniref:hypothetical protein n=1 Tax=Microbacterium sp. TaxID=51671 RepID=UPI003F70D645
MSYSDQVLLQALLLVDGATGDEQRAAEAYEAAYAATRRRGGNIDAIHVAQWLASSVAQFIQQRPDWRPMLDEQILQARLIADLDLPGVEPELAED